MKRLVFIGDSLTEFFDWQDRFRDFQVTNLGISGETVEGLLSRLDLITSSIDNPDVIFIMSGINNIAMEDYEIIDTYKKIIERLSNKFNPSTIVIQGILPVYLPWIDNNVIKKINDSLKRLADDFKVEYLDTYSLFIDPKGIVIRDYLLDDGVHLSNKGYDVWTKRLDEYLKTRFGIIN